MKWRAARGAGATLLVSWLVALPAGAQDATPQPAAPVGATSEAAATTTPSSLPPPPPTIRYAAAAAFAPPQGAQPAGSVAEPPPPEPMVRERAYPALLPLGIVTASVGAGGGLILGIVSLSDNGESYCNSPYTPCDNDGAQGRRLAVAWAAGGLALLGVGLIIAGVTLDGPVVPVRSQAAPPPVRDPGPAPRLPPF